MKKFLISFLSLATIINPAVFVLAQTTDSAGSSAVGSTTAPPPPTAGATLQRFKRPPPPPGSGLEGLINSWGEKIIARIGELSNRIAALEIKVGNGGDGGGGGRGDKCPVVSAPLNCLGRIIDAVGADGCRTYKCQPTTCVAVTRVNCLYGHKDDTVGPDGCVIFGACEPEPKKTTTCETQNSNWKTVTWGFSDGTTKTSCVLKGLDQSFIDSVNRTCSGVKFVAWRPGQENDAPYNDRSFGVPDCGQGGTTGGGGTVTVLPPVWESCLREAIPTVASEKVEAALVAIKKHITDRTQVTYTGEIDPALYSKIPDCERRTGAYLTTLTGGTVGGGGTGGGGSMSGYTWWDAARTTCVAGLITARGETSSKAQIIANNMALCSRSSTDCNNLDSLAKADMGKYGAEGSSSQCGGGYYGGGTGGSVSCGSYTTQNTCPITTCTWGTPPGSYSSIASCMYPTYSGGTGTYPRCGDGVCNTNESPSICPADCSTACPANIVGLSGCHWKSTNSDGSNRYCDTPEANHIDNTWPTKVVPSCATTADSGRGPLLAELLNFLAGIFK